MLWLNIIQELRLYQFDFDYLAWFGLQGHNMCVYVCMYICMYVHICVYIFCTYVYLYLIVYNWFKRGHFNIFLIYFELGKHVCIFLYSFILWQIDAYWLWALSKGTVTFIEGYLVDWVIPEKNPNGQSSRTGGHFWKNPGIFRFVTLPLEIVNSREKKG